MDILPIFACVMAISLLSGILMTLKGSSGANTAIDTVFYICYAAALVPILGVLVECFTQTAKAITSMQQQMQLIFPLMLTLMAASGGALTVSICKPAVGFFSATIVSVIAQIVLPIAILIVAFSVAGNFTQELKIGKFTAFFKSINKWIMGICISVFGVFFTLQGLTAAHYDGIVRRAAKYAIGNGVPIIGGFLSGGFDLAIAGGILIKNSLGSLGIMLMLSVLFEPLLLLISVTLLLRFTSAIVQPFGDTRVSDFLSDTADNLHYCTAGLLLTAFLYFLCIVLMISASEVLL
jgi:stage III sporulation protein AE